MPRSEKARLSTGQACIPCREQKRRCDRSSPCGTCVRYRRTCSHQEKGPSTNTVASPRNDQHYSSTSNIVPRPPDRAEKLPSDTVESQMIPARSQGGYLDTGKARFIEQHSSASHARSLGIQLGLSDPPRLHAFAHHLGIRKEAHRTVQFCLVDMIAWQDVQALLDVYAAVVHPVFNFLDLDNFFKHCQSHWNSNSQSLAFEAVAGGVIAFASLFSGVLSEELEMAIVLHAKNVLNDPAESRSPSLNTAVGWVLRTLYVRATGRPYEAYSASLTSVSMVQAMGLHRAADSVQSAGAGGPDSIADYFNVMQRRVATVAQSLHILFSYDYGRSVLDIGLANLDQEGSDTSNYTIALQQLAQVVPLNPPTADPTAMRQYLDQALQDLLAIRCSHDFVTLMRVELGLSIYRRLRVLDFQLQKLHVQGVLELSSTATSAALRLSAQKRPWWNIVSTIFQVVCVMLSINTRESLASLAEAMGALQTVDDIFKTNLTNEALSTARLLVNACKKKKATELDLLEQVGGKDPVSSTVPEETYYLSAELDLETFLRPISDVGYFDFLDNPSGPHVHCSVT